MLRNVEVAKDYWKSRNDEHRNNYLISIFDKYNPSSVLEIGCNCGNKLYPLACRYPNAKLYGIDINQIAM